MDEFVKSISNVTGRGRNWCTHSESEGKRKEKSHYGKAKGEIVQTVKYIRPLPIQILKYAQIAFDKSENIRTSTCIAVSSEINCIQMAKRKHDCSLNDIVIEHLRTSKCERTLKLLERQENACGKAMYDDFVSYLKQNEVEKENSDDDLGFEINFGAFQPEQKVIFQVISTFITVLV